MNWLGQLPEPLQKALEGRTEAFIEEIAMCYLAASDDDQAGMLSFITSGGPEEIERLRREDSS